MMCPDFAVRNFYEGYPSFRDFQGFFACVKVADVRLICNVSTLFSPFGCCIKMDFTWYCSIFRHHSLVSFRFGAQRTIHRLDHCISFLHWLTSKLEQFGLASSYVFCTRDFSRQYCWIPIQALVKLYERPVLSFIFWLMFLQFNEVCKDIFSFTRKRPHRCRICCFFRPNCYHFIEVATRENASMGSPFPFPCLFQSSNSLNYSWMYVTLQQLGLMIPLPSYLL